VGKLGGSKRKMLTGWCRDKEFIDGITPEVALAVSGRVVTVEGEDDEAEVGVDVEAKAKK